MKVDTGLGRGGRGMHFSVIPPKNICIQGDYTPKSAHKLGDLCITLQELNFNEVFEKFHLLFVQCLLLIVSLCGKYSCVYLRMVVWKVWKVYLCLLTDGSLENLESILVYACGW